MNIKTLASSVGMFILGAIVGQLVARNSWSDQSSAAKPVPLVSQARIDPTVARTSIQTSDCNSVAGEAASTPQDAFASAVAEADGEWKYTQLTAAFTRLLSQSPEEALRVADRIPIEYRQQVVSAALAQFAAQKPDRALGAIDGITANYGTYLGVVLGVLAEQNPGYAVEIAIQNAHRDPTGEIFSSLIPALVHSNLDMAASVVNAMEKPPLPLIQQVASGYARNDPERAYQWAAQSARRSGHNSVDEAVNTLSMSIALSSPEAAMNFLGRTQDATIRNSLIRAISQRMGQQDLRTAWRWLSQYRTEAAYSENAGNLLYRWSYVKAEEVAELLPSIEDRGMQSAVAEELATAWQRSDPNAYQAWRSSLPSNSILRGDR
jgi:hypothetical protein